MDTLIKSIVAFGGSAVSYFYGGWSSLLGILLVFVVMDYLSGIAAAGKEGKLNSAVGRWGIPKKIAIFAMVAIAHLIDTVIGDAHLFRDATIFFYLANELLSIVENIGRLGAPIPPVITKAVEVLRGKGGTDESK